LKCKGHRTRECQTHFCIGKVEAIDFEKVEQEEGKKRRARERFCLGKRIKCCEGGTKRKRGEEKGWPNGCSQRAGKWPQVRLRVRKDSAKRWDNQGKGKRGKMWGSPRGKGSTVWRRVVKTLTRVLQPGRDRAKPKSWQKSRIHDWELKTAEGTSLITEIIKNYHLAGKKGKCEWPQKGKRKEKKLRLFELQRVTRAKLDRAR